ncbi:MAG: hypothetical protein AW07_04736 [Candidatus Accumulibacter sp. SK-11]|nr:MAG: hypothetical protein AW07_04736 [Candidatus Accumulibacter sp. SK-11]
MLLPPFPVSVLFKALPVPLMAEAPVRMRFSTSSARVWVALDRTRSVPSPGFSQTTSPASSTI